MPRRLSPHESTVSGSVLDRCPASAGSGVLPDLSPAAAWRALMPRLLCPGDRVATTSADDPSLGGLIHRLWWDPSVRAVLVVRDETSPVATDLDEVRRAVELSGSGALLLVDSCGSHRLAADTGAADLVVAAAGRGSLLAWSPRLAPSLALLDGLLPVTYDVLERLHAERR